MDETNIREVILKILRERIGNIKENSLEIKFIQTFKDKYDIYGKFENNEGFFEFTIILEDNKLRRFHVNMIMPKNVKSEIENKVKIKD
jgi:hypothetical protein